MVEFYDILIALFKKCIIIPENFVEQFRSDLFNRARVQYAIGVFQSFPVTRDSRHGICQTRGDLPLQRIDQGSGLGPFPGVLASECPDLWPQEKDLSKYQYLPPGS